MTKEEFEWAWNQAPDTSIVRTLEENQRVMRCWDRAWICGGPIRVASDPTTVCAVHGFPPRVVPLLVLVQIQEDETHKFFRMAIGQCETCRRIYWQADNVNLAVGRE